MFLRVGSAFRRASYVVALASVFSATAFAQKTFSFPHVFEISGRIVGIGWNLRGGQFTVDTMPPTVDRIYTDYEQIDALFSLHGNDEILKWSTSEGILTPLDFDIYSLDKDETTMMTAYQMLPLEFGFPGCDVDDHDPAGMRIRMYSLAREATTRARNVASFKAGTDLAKKQKMFFPSNFRLTLGDLPCARTAKVDAFSVKQNIITVPVGKELISRSIQDVTFHVPTSDGGPFQEALKASLAGTPKDLPFRLDYLDGDGNVLLSVMMSCAVVSVAPSDMFADPNDSSATLRVKVHKYIGTVTIVK